MKNIKNIKRIIAIMLIAIIIVMMMFTMTGCRQSHIVAYNVSREADNFGVVRKLTVVNVRSDKILMELTGTFSIANNAANELEVICKTGNDEYKKHFVYLNEWTVYTVEDISGADVESFRYEIVFYPEMIPVADYSVEFGG